MNTILKGIGTLTTEHTASCYGIPVLIVDGIAHGPADTYFVPDIGENTKYGHSIATFANRRAAPGEKRKVVGMKFSELARPELTEDAVELCRKFCASDPTGTQVN